MGRESILFLLRLNLRSFRVASVPRRVTISTLCSLFVASVSVEPSPAQTIGECIQTYPYSSTEIDIANVRARVHNNGALFWIGGSPVYEVPKDSGKNSVFAASTWIGGMVDGELRMSAATYSDWEFWPGPLDENGNPPADCSAYDRIYTVYDEDIRQYNESGEATEDMRDWPWQLGAPVFDGDGIPDNYDLAAGDRPYVYGDQTAWWVMNDAGNEHLSTRTKPLGLEVRVTAFAADGPHGTWIRDATFYRYELVYRGSSPADSMYFGIHVDVDLGDSGDDYVGCDTTLSLGYGYNGDDFDAGTRGYGDRPPAVGFQFIQGPGVDESGPTGPGRTLGMSSFLWIVKSWISESPAADFYDYMQGRWPGDRGPVTVGGSGYNPSSPGPTTHFMFPADPPGFWSEDDIDGQGTAYPPADRRFIMSTGPFRMEPGDTQELVFAVLWAQGSDRIGSVRRLETVASNTASALTYLMTFDTADGPPDPPSGELGPITYGLGHHPNPASEFVQIRFELPEPSATRLVLYDLLGRQIDVLAEGLIEPGRVTVDYDVNDLPAGVYLYRLETRGFVTGRPLTIVH